MDGLISLILIAILIIIVAGVGIWALRTLSGAFGLPAPVVAVGTVLIVLLAVLIFINRAWPEIGAAA